MHSLHAYSKSRVSVGDHRRGPSAPRGHNRSLAPYNLTPPACPMPIHSLVPPPPVHPDWIFFGETLNSFFGAQDEGFSELRSR